MRVGGYHHFARHGDTTKRPKQKKTKKQTNKQPNNNSIYNKIERVFVIVLPSLSTPPNSRILPFVLLVLPSMLYNPCFHTKVDSIVFFNFCRRALSPDWGSRLQRQRSVDHAAKA